AANTVPSSARLVTWRPKRIISSPVQEGDATSCRWSPVRRGVGGRLRRRAAPSGGELRLLRRKVGGAAADNGARVEAHPGEDARGEGGAGAAGADRVDGLRRVE